MPHHIDSHIHLLIQLSLSQFARQLDREHIGLIDMLAIQFEDYLVTSLSIVSMKVVLLQEIILQCIHRLKESCRIRIIEGTCHIATHGDILLRRLVVGCCP